MQYWRLPSNCLHYWWLSPKELRDDPCRSWRFNTFTPHLQKKSDFCRHISLKMEIPLQHNPYYEGIFSIFILDTGKLPFRCSRLWFYLILLYQLKPKKTPKLVQESKKCLILSYVHLDQYTVMKKCYCSTCSSPLTYTWIHSHWSNGTQKRQGSHGCSKTFN